MAARRGGDPGAGIPFQRQPGTQSIRPSWMALTGKGIRWSNRSRNLAAVAALSQADLTGDTLFAVHVQVADGTAYLTGNVRLPVQKEDTQKAVASAKGVLNVQNDVVTDWDMSISIAQALAEDGLMRQGLVTVKSSLGRIRLSGHLATQELVDSAVAVAAGVGGVRSVEHDVQVRPLPTAEPEDVVVAETEAR